MAVACAKLMNRYRRYPQIHAATTAHLSLMEEGAYSRLLDWQYSNEFSLPATPEERWRIRERSRRPSGGPSRRWRPTSMPMAGSRVRAKRSVVMTVVAGKAGQAGASAARPHIVPRDRHRGSYAASAGCATAIATQPSPAQQPHDRTMPPSIPPKAILDGRETTGRFRHQGERHPRNPGGRVRSRGQGRGLELLRQCEREAPRNPAAS